MVALIIDERLIVALKDVLRSAPRRGILIAVVVQEAGWEVDYYTVNALDTTTDVAQEYVMGSY